MFKIILNIICIILFSGCTAAMYQPNIHTYNLVTGQEIKATDAKILKANPAPTLTTFEQWPSMWSAVCGTIITGADGKIVGNLSGFCGTPLTVFMNSSVNIGLASAGASLIH